MADAQLRLARENFRRMSELRTTNATTQENLDQATQALDAAEGAVAAQQEELTLLKRAPARKRFAPRPRKWRKRTRVGTREKGVP